MRYLAQIGSSGVSPMNALMRAQRKWNSAAARQAAAIARRHDRFIHITVTGSILLFLLVSLTNQIR